MCTCSRPKYNPPTYFFLHLGSNPPNIIPANISSYTVYYASIYVVALFTEMTPQLLGLPGVTRFFSQKNYARIQSNPLSEAESMGRKIRQPYWKATPLHLSHFMETGRKCHSYTITDIATLFPRRKKKLLIIFVHCAVNVLS